MSDHTAPTGAGVGSYVHVGADPVPARVVDYLSDATHPWVVRLADGQTVMCKPSQLTWIVDGLPAVWGRTLQSELEGLGL